MLEQNEKGSCICEKTYFHTEANSQHQRPHKEYHQRVFNFVKDKNINDSEETIIKLHQRRYFKEEIDLLQKIKNRSQNSLPNSSKISILDPFLDDKKILHVGDRLKRSNLNLDYIHTILLSGEGIVTNLIINWYHHSVGHGGIGYTLNKIRSSGFWIVKVNSVV